MLLFDNNKGPIKFLGKIIFASSLFFSQAIYSQVPANVNATNVAGINPAFPFPQFLKYNTLSNLADQNPVGVPHAELEQRTIDAYQILLNNTMYTGNTVGGVQYIRPNGTTCTCAEAYGYYLLAAAFMADKTTFDGMYMFMHDNNFHNVKRFIDGGNNPFYRYSNCLSGAGNFGSPTGVTGAAATGGAATDGDVDIALALLMAWKQWGDNSGITAPVPYAGGQMSYKQEAINYIRNLADTLRNTTIIPNKFDTGDIGLDGYVKNGDTWGEITNWANAGYLGIVPEYAGSQFMYVDYMAPAYFNNFYRFLNAQGVSPFCQSQYQRAEASSDWIMGQLLAPTTRIPMAGNVTVAGSTATFTNSNAAEDMRLGARTILNYVWHGNPTTTWAPGTHQAAVGGNTYERDMGIRYASFLKNNQAAPWSNPCKTYGSSAITYGSVAALSNYYTFNGGSPSAFHLNWIFGAGSPSAVAAQDFDLMARLFRECVLEWDQNGGGQNYLTSTPVYFHEWFRLFGMLVLTGNFQSPMNLTAAANMKIYESVDKTFAYTGDNITYTLTYRNYGSVNASNVVITENIPAGLTFVSATGGGTVSGSTVTWNIGTVPGRTATNLAATKGTVTLVLNVSNTATGRICNPITISTTTGTGWTTNEYPNNITEVMERNCVDILATSPMVITKTASKSFANPGDTLSYTITVKNNTVPFLNGGRQGVILAAAHNGLAASNSLYFKYRVYHGAQEAYINYKNYRVSYFMNKIPEPTWILSTTINEGVATAPTLTQQTLVPGATWNHRFILQFPDQVAATTPHLYNYSGVATRIHQGALVPQRLVAYIHDASWTTYSNWGADWSAEPGITAADGDPYWPITNDWTDPYLPNVVVTKYHPEACGTAATTVKKQLVEEWDGYTWRRVFGDAPVSGRELLNVVLKDILPPEVTFQGYFTGTPAGTISGSTITWPTISLLRINETITYKIWVKVNSNAYFGCPGTPTPSSFTNTATVKADNEPLKTATALTSVNCVGTTPVTIISFTGRMMNGNAFLTWATASEKNNAGFVVQKSSDGVHFDSIGYVLGNGNSAVTLNYTFTDKNVIPGITYYQLVQTDVDGTKEKTNIISVNAEENSILLYPNPYTNYTTLRVNGSEHGKISVKIIAVTGILVFSADNYFTNEDISLGADLPDGVYILQMSDGHQEKNFRLVKSK